MKKFERNKDLQLSVESCIFGDLNIN